MSEEHQLERLWEDSNNWNSLGAYSCKEDPRLVVPKRIRCLGWTINAAHRKAWYMVVVFILLALMPVLLVIRYVSQDTVPVLAAVVVSAALVSGLSAYMARTTGR